MRAHPEEPRPVTSAARTSVAASARSGRQNLTGFLIVIVLAVLTLRVATLGLSTLHDRTEARYGNIARVMLETGNWVTPQQAPGSPFWAKPPLFAWASAGSMAALGVNEFAVRLPSAVFTAAALFLTVFWARTRAADRGATADEARAAGWAAGAVLATSALWFVSAGAVMTEASMLLATTGIGVTFWFAVVRGGPGDTPLAPAWARWGFFLSVGVGLLAKGPVVPVLAGLPIFVWLVVERQWRRMWERLPWLRGTAVALLVAAPWYAWAELRTPGFLRYFILGEHFGRFLVPNWPGDLYGQAHAFPPGTIWAFWLMAALPWSFVALGRVVRWWRGRRDGARLDADTRFLVLNVVVPLVFFTAARNIIWTYPIATLPALALLLAGGRLGAWWRPMLVATAAVYAVAFIWLLPRNDDRACAAGIVAEYRARAANAPGPLYFVGETLPHSARFYSRGEARLLAPGDPLPPASSSAYFVFPARGGGAEARGAWRQQLTEAARRGDFVLCVQH